jgi:pyruvate dehydrogenase E2 component (dihydrolipoamide acetyltransferase)
MTTTRRGITVKEVMPLNQIQRVMAKTMKSSIETQALSLISREIDMTLLTTFISSRKEQKPLSLNTLLMAVIARTLSQHPYLNSELVDQQIYIYEQINLGMAVATQAGLVVVVIHDANLLSLNQLSEAIETKVQKARTGNLSLSDIEGSTFTVSNLGMYGVDAGFPIPRAPECAILLIGAIRPRPVVVNGQIVIRDIGTLSLTFDHRFIDGEKAAIFLGSLNHNIQEPQTILGQDVFS